MSIKIGEGRIQATVPEKSAAFEWLRGQALNTGNPDARRAAIMLQEVHDLNAIVREGLTFDALGEANLLRAMKWHRGGLDEWSIADWATAMAGEAGEVCNAVKKLRRIEDEIANISDPERQLSTRQEALKKIGEEIADTLIYLDLLAQRCGINLTEAVIEKYNLVSAKYGFEDRIVNGRHCLGAPS